MVNKPPNPAAKAAVGTFIVLCFALMWIIGIAFILLLAHVAT